MSGDWVKFQQEPKNILDGSTRTSPAFYTSARVNSRVRDEITIGVSGEILSLLAFCNRHSIDYHQIAIGAPDFQGYQGYRVINAIDGKEVESIAISRPNGRFGNNFKQIIHAILVAKTLGINKIYMPDFDLFSEAENQAGSDIRIIKYHDRKEIRDVSLYGTFFYHQSLGNLIRSNASSNQIIVNQYISPIFKPLTKVSHNPANHIAIHVRSGDLFDKKNPHPRYPQPPLAFYIKVIEHFMGMHDDIVVSLVYQDKGNPVIERLQNYVSANGIVTHEYSGNLSDDLTTLLSHQALVFGRGTFGKAVASLAPYLKTIYFPWTDSDFRHVCNARKINGYMVNEIDDKYIKIGQWKNSREQRDLMVEYPIANLSIGPMS